MNGTNGLDSLYPYHNFLEPIIYFFTLKQSLFLFVFEPVFTINTRALIQIKAFNEQQKCLHAFLS